MRNCRILGDARCVELVKKCSNPCKDVPLSQLLEFVDKGNNIKAPAMQELNYSRNIKLSG
ncbi:hypothetical protein JCM17380_17900 [Desulfosporosinus burensis]